jgi:uncharacterized protein (DUF302 family)
LPQTPHTERHFTGSARIRDIVISMSDGLTVPFALRRRQSGKVPTRMNHTQLTYGTTRDVALDFPDALARAKALLAEQGFGVLCEIDVAATLRTKLSIDIGDYVILGACKPDSASRVLAADPDAGLLLPCNVVVRRSAGRTTVGIIDANAMVKLIGHDELASVAADVSLRLTAVLDGIGSPH